MLGQIDAIGVDEIQYSKGHKYLTLVYQIDLGITRLLWIGKERTIESFQGFFTTMGEEITSRIVFVCSDMWEPYLKVIREKCSEALHILDRFHIVAKMNKALDEVRAERSRRMSSEGRKPVLRKSRWLLLKREENLAMSSDSACAISSAITSKPSALIFSRKPFNSSGITARPPGPASSWMNGAARPCVPASSP